MKRVFDMLLASLALLVLSPVLVGTALVVKLTSRGPVFFRQERMGRNFRRFFIYKFRTMVPDAHQRGPQLTSGEDPRITWVGKFLRKAKLDELPQLLNVLKGDMSFVGPRPEVPRYVDLFRDDYAAVLRVRPGITDLASIKYANEAEILGQVADPEAEYVQRILPDKLKLGKEYVEQSSLLFDLRLLIVTGMTVMRNSVFGKKKTLTEASRNNREKSL